jgi:hypothetical protein
MQSHLLEFRPFATTRGRGGAAAWGISVRTCVLTCEQSVPFGPVKPQIDFRQTRRGELDGLPALQDRFDQLRALTPWRLSLRQPSPQSAPLAGARGHGCSAYASDFPPRN